MSHSAHTKKELIIKYIGLVRSNWERGYSPGRRPRNYEYVGLSNSVLRARSIPYLMDAIKEEQKILQDSRRRPTEFALEMMAVDKSLPRESRKYATFVEQRRERAEDKYIEFDRDCFEKEMCVNGHEEIYISFDAQFSTRERVDLRYRKKMIRLRAKVEKKLRDYSSESRTKIEIQEDLLVH